MAIWRMRIACWITKATKHPLSLCNTHCTDAPKRYVACVVQDNASSAFCGSWTFLYLLYLFCTHLSTLSLFVTLYVVGLRTSLHLVYPVTDSVKPTSHQHVLYFQKWHPVSWRTWPRRFKRRLPCSDLRETHITNGTVCVFQSSVLIMWKERTASHLRLQVAYGFAAQILMKLSEYNFVHVCSAGGSVNQMGNVNSTGKH